MKKNTKKTYKKSAKEKIDVYQLVTDRIIALLEKGTVPWRKTWKSSGIGSFGFMNSPMNLKTKKAYRGINIFLLGSAGFESKYWATYKQIQEMGGQVRGGEKSETVVFWKKIMMDDEDKVTGEVKKKMIFLLKQYKVFNVEQADGLDGKVPQDEAKKPEIKSDEERINEAIEAAEELLKAMPEQPVLHHKGESAFYHPTTDEITMPPKNTFDSSEAYYATLFHEAIHWTGHPSRSPRKGIADVSLFGSETYSKEELVAEMGSAFLCGMTGIIDGTIDNSASYIQNWLKVLKSDKKFVIIASSQAEKAVKWMINEKEEIKEDEESK